MPPQIPNIYTLGQIEVNAQPLAQLQGKLLAQRQAELEAINKYYDKKLGSMSPEGIFEADQPGFQKKIDNLKQYWIDNKSEINKGGIGKANFDAKINELNNWVVTSKQRKQNWLKGNEFRLQNKLGGADIDVINKMEKPTDDPDSKKLDGSYWSWTDFGVMVPDFDASKRSAFHNTIVGDEKPAVKSKVGKPRLIGGNEYEQDYSQSYSPQQLQFFEKKIEGLLPSNDAAYKDYENLKANPTSQRFRNLYDVWNSTPWHKGDPLDTPEKLAKADFLFDYRRAQIKPEKFSPTIKSAGPTPVSADIAPYLIFPKYNAEITNLPDGRKAIPAARISSTDLGKIKVTPEFVNGEDYYIVKDSGVWLGEGGQKIVDEDLAVQAAPQNVREEYLKKKAGAGRGKKTGAKGL